jgi:hypothetical protein
MASKAISYVCFDELIVLLRDDGLFSDADRLYLLLHEVAWTTGSELVGELGQALSKIEKKESPSRSVNSAQKIEECFKMVGRVWPDFPR